jgi:hypothetical protein
MSINRIMQAGQRRASPSCAVVVELLRARQAGASADGNGVDLEDGKTKFKAAWAAIRAGAERA